MHSDYFQGKVALITGSSSGIGATTARLFAKYECTLSLSGRNIENLQKIQQKCIDEGLNKNKIIFHAGDVTDENFLQQMVDETIEKFGKLDILVF